MVGGGGGGVKNVTRVGAERMQPSNSECVCCQASVDRPLGSVP